MKKNLWMILGLFLLTAPTFAGSSIPWMTGEKTWVLGLNYPWINFGDDFSEKGYQPDQFKKDVDAMSADGVHVIRYWIFPRLSPAPLWTGTGKGSLCTGLPENWVKNMVEATDYAYSKGIRVYYSWVSFDMGHKDNKEMHDDIMTNPKVRASFFENAVKPIVTALGKHPGVMGWDVINEPEWIIQEAAGDENLKKNDCFPLETMRKFIAAFTAYLHTTTKQPVSVGSCMKWVGGEFDYYSGLGLDFFDLHYYDWMTKWNNPVTQPASSLKLADKGKPIIVGECMANPLKEYSGPGKPLSNYQMAVSLYNNGYAGLLSWSWNSDDHLKDNPEIIKNDFPRFYNLLQPQKPKAGKK